MAIDQLDDAVDERLTLEVPYLPQRDVAAEMVVAVSVAAWAAQRALARNLDGKRRSVPGENPSPGRNDPFQNARPPPTL